MKIVFYWLMAGLFLLSSLSASAQLIRHTYNFYNNLSASAPDCGPDLVPVHAGESSSAPCSPHIDSGGYFTSASIPFCGVTRSVYHNNMHWGLSYPNTFGTIANTYSIFMFVRNTNWGTRAWARIIDFSSGLSDNGIYYYRVGSNINRCLDFYPNGVVGPCPYFDDTTWYLLTFTRNETSRIINVYVNNTLFSSYNDNGNFYVGTPGTPIYIYRDDQVVTCESGEANFAYLAFTNQYSTQSTVDSVYNLICSIANPGATSSFNLNPNPACDSSNVIVTYTGIVPPPGTGYTFNWNWGSATVLSGTGMGPYIVRWDTPGVKTVSLSVVNDTCGIPNTTVQQIRVGARSSLTLDTAICFGQSYQGYSSSGTYVDNFVNSEGCDSVRTLHLTVNPASNTVITQTICEGESFEGYSTSGMFVDSFANSLGCDSLRTLYLTVNPRTSGSISQAICEGASYSGHSASGDYVDTLVNINGCDSIRTLHLAVIPLSRSQVTQSVCEGQSVFGYTTSGVYTDTFLAASGCDSVRTLRLTVIPRPHPDLGPDRELCRDDSLILSPGRFSTYLWQDGSSLDHFVVTQPGVFRVTVTDSCGIASDEVKITDKVCVPYFPSGFTPNRDGKNDLFKILNAVSLKNFSLAVYNRWGEKVFQTYNYSVGWDGTFNGRLQDPGAYVWICSFKRNNLDYHLKGTVLLIR